MPGSSTVISSSPIFTPRTLLLVPFIAAFIFTDVQILSQVCQVFGLRSDADVRVFWRRRLPRKSNVGAGNDGRIDAVRPQHLYAAQLRPESQGG